MITKIKYIIVGAGPSGLQMAYFLKKANLDYLILEKNNTAGSFYSKFPIHRSLISINKKYNFFEEEDFNMRHDWNSLLSDQADLKFTNYTDELYPSADLLYQYFNDYRNQLDLNVAFNTSVEKISKTDNGDFLIKTDKGDYLAKILLMATGAFKQIMPEEIEGIELTTAYENISNNPKEYINKRVAIIGGGNSAFETANSLLSYAANVHVFIKNKVKLSYETHFVGDLRAKYTNIFDLYQLKSLHAILKPRIKKITALEDGTLQTQHEYDFPESENPGTLQLTRQYDTIINCTGFKYTNLDIFDKECCPNTIKNAKFYDLKSNWESTNVSNLFFIGTTMQAIDRQSASGFIHGFRYNIRTLSNILQEKLEGKSYPSYTLLRTDIENILKKLYERFSVGDAIYQLYGTLGDLLTINGDEVKWQKDLPLNYIKEQLNPAVKSITLSLEFGFNNYPKQSSLDFLGPSDPNDTSKAVFLHPVIRYYFQGEVSEFHFGDSLLGRWDLPHEDGGAVASYHNEFYNWLIKILDLDLEAKNIGELDNYKKW